MNLLPRLIFMSRWLQVPLYLGLIVAQCVYVWQFWVELVQAFTEKAPFYQTVIHITFLLSAVAIAAVDRIMPAPAHRNARGHGSDIPEELA